jgi:hypothetical protein
LAAAAAADGAASRARSKPPRDFTRKTRKIIRSEQVSADLNRWIDLIFGTNRAGRRKSWTALCSAAAQHIAGEDQVEGEAPISRIVNFGQWHRRSSRHLMSDPSAVLQQRLNASRSCATAAIGVGGS